MDNSLTIKIRPNVTWFKDAKFGMFIHWGLYSVLGRGEWAMHDERIPVNEYTQLANFFKPKKDCIREWVETAKSTGMRYVVFTTKHHDGFALFDSSVSDYTSVKTAAKRDFVQEFVDACRESGLRIGFYYSLMDWYWYYAKLNWKYPFAKHDMSRKSSRKWSEFIKYTHAQVQELCTNYGKIDIFWFDGEYPKDPVTWKAEVLEKIIRSHQPHILINNRGLFHGDFDTPEQTVCGTSGLFESCMTIGSSWGYHAGTNDFKSPAGLIHNLALTASQGGNYLLNIGPKADGSICMEERKCLKEISKWLQVHGRSIYNSVRHERIDLHNEYGVTTYDGKNTLFIQVFYWMGKSFSLCGLRNKVISARLLTNEKRIDFKQLPRRLIFKNLPKSTPNPYCSVIELKIKGKLHNP